VDRNIRQGSKGRSLGSLVDVRVMRADYRALVANDVLNDGRTDARVFHQRCGGVSQRVE